MVDTHAWQFATVLNSFMYAEADCLALWQDMDKGMLDPKMNEERVELVRTKLEAIRNHISNAMSAIEKVNASLKPPVAAISFGKTASDGDAQSTS